MAGFWFPNGDVRLVYDSRLEAAIAALAPIDTVWKSFQLPHYMQKSCMGMCRVETNTAVAEIYRFCRKAERRQAAAAVAAAAQGASYSLQNRARLR